MLHTLRDKLCNELMEYTDREMTMGSLEIIDKLAHAIKNIDKIIDRDYPTVDTPPDRMRQEIRALIEKLESWEK